MARSVVGTVHCWTEADQPQCDFGDGLGMLQWDEVVGEIEHVRDEDEFADVDEWMGGEELP